MTVKEKVKSHPNVVDYFKERPFYNKHTEKHTLNETKGFKYQTTLKVNLKKYKPKEIEFAPIYSNSTTKTLINLNFSLENTFQEILYSIDNIINKACG